MIFKLILIIALLVALSHQIRVSNKNGGSSKTEHKDLESIESVNNPTSTSSKSSNLQPEQSGMMSTQEINARIKNVFGELDPNLDLVEALNKMFDPSYEINQAKRAKEKAEEERKQARREKMRRIYNYFNLFKK